MSEKISVEIRWPVPDPELEEMFRDGDPDCVDFDNEFEEAAVPAQGSRDANFAEDIAYVSDAIDRLGLKVLDRTTAPEGARRAILIEVQLTQEVTIERVREELPGFVVEKVAA